MKNCSVCKEEKPKSDFSKNNGGRDGYATYCKSCEKQKRERLKLQWQQNQKNILSVEPKRTCGSCKVEKDIFDFSKSKGHKNGFYIHCKECVNERWWSGINDDKRITYLLQRKRSYCKKHGIEFDLTKDDIVIPQRCPILGMPLKFGYQQNDWGNRKDENSPSIDRIDPTKGYTKDNIIIVSTRANTIKYNATLEELNKITNFYNQLQKNNAKQKIKKEQ